MKITRVLFPDRARQSFTLKMGVGFTQIILVTLIFGAAVAAELSTVAERGDVTAVHDVALSGILGLILLTVINLGLFAATVGGNMTASLRRLESRAEQIGDGDLDVDLSTRRSDELGRLYESFDEMRQSLQSSLQETEQAREEATEEKERAKQARQEVEQERERLERINDRLQGDASRFSETMDACAAGDFTRRLDAQSDNQAMSRSTR